MNAYAVIEKRLLAGMVHGHLEDLAPEVQEFYRQSKKKFLADADEFLAREIEPRKPLLTNAETGSTVLLRSP